MRLLTVFSVWTLIISASPVAVAQSVLTSPPAPSKPQPGDRCYLSPLPPKQISRRLQMAQNLLNSKNPDLITQAQVYLDQGLTEQHQLDMQYQQLQQQRAIFLGQKGCPPEG